MKTENEEVTQILHITINDLKYRKIMKKKK